MYIALPFIVKNKSITVTIYDNVAQSDPYGSKALISSYGFVVPPNSDDPDVLAQALCDLVAEVGTRH